MEDLLEQEKREQEHQAASVVSNEMVGGNTPTNSQGLLSDQDFERLRADVLNSAPRGMPNQGLIPVQQQQPQPQQPMQLPNANQFVAHNSPNRQAFLQRGVGQQQWRAPIHPQQQMNSSVGVINSAGPSIEPTMVKKEGLV